VLGFVGCGNMAQAMLKGILAKGLYKADEIIVSRRTKEALDALHEELGVQTTTDNKEVAEKADVLVLAIKPYQFADVIPEIAPVCKENALVISIAAGQTIANIEKLFGKTMKIVRTMPNTPALVHGGPFANIAHGCNSVRATKTALKLADYTITEAGFGADLGAEKFLDIKCRMADLKPDAVVLVATVRALKYNGGVKKEDLSEENLDALKAGIVNLEKHIENIAKFGVPCVVTLNEFVTDSEAELAYVKEFCEARGCEFALSKVWEKGGEGGIELAQKVIDTIENKESNFHYLYENELSIVEKIETIAKEIYGAGEVIIEPAAKQQIARIESLGFGSMPVCMAKNQYSLSDDKTILGRPEGFPIHIRDVYVSAGAGFVVAITGTIMTMPGLPKVPAAEGIDVNDDGQITGLF